MPRPLKLTAEYFSHDSDTRNHRKIKVLRNEFGLDGYAVYFLTLEILAGKDFQRIFRSPIEDQLWAGDMGIKPARLRKIWRACIDLDLFQVEEEGGGKYLTCEGLKERLKPLFEKRSRDRGGGRKKAVVSGSENGVSGSENPEGDKNGFRQRKQGFRQRPDSENGVFANDNHPKGGFPTAKTPQTKLKEKKEEKREDSFIEKKEEKLEEIQKRYLDFLRKNNSLRREGWKARALPVMTSAEYEGLELAFVNRSIKNDEILSRRGAMAGFDAYLNTTISKKRKQNGNTNSRNTRIFGSGGDTSARKPETEFGF